MAGFFASSKLTSAVGKQRSCVQCGLMKNSCHPKMKISGQGKKGIFILGDFPTRTADKKGTQIEGKTKRILTKTLSSLGVNLEEDCYIMNAVNCAIKGDAPEYAQIEACRKSIQAEYINKKPRLIIIMGDSAIQSHWSHRWKNEINTVHNWRGWVIPDHYFNAWTAPIHSPFKILEEGAFPVAPVVWKNDIEKALSFLDQPLPEHIDETNVDVLLEESDALDFMSDLWKDGHQYMSFDYETTGLKPYFKGHDIACVGISTDTGKCAAFMLPSKVRYELKKYLARNNSFKIAQNMKFEDMWTRIILKGTVKNWFFDPMIATHILDNRPGITGLKYQSFVRYGITDYESEITPFIKTKGGANALNNVFKAPKRALLCYCGMDSLLTLKIANDERIEMGFGGFL